MNHVTDTTRLEHLLDTFQRPLRPYMFYKQSRYAQPTSTTKKLEHINFC